LVVLAKFSKTKDLTENARPLRNADAGRFAVWRLTTPPALS
jgi:hypothetical protein